MSSGEVRAASSVRRTTGPTRRSSAQWTPQEDEILVIAVQKFNGKNWKKIAECLKDRTDVQCLHRWQKVLNPELVKGAWSKEEDEIIIDLVNKNGPKKWSSIAQHLPGRIGKQCRERWHNHLNPGIKKEAWTQEEELALIRAHQIYGNKWAELTKFLPGRTDNAIKNHWNSSVKKKVDLYLASGLLSQFPAGNSGNQILPTTCSSSDTFVVEDSREEESGGVNDDEEPSYYEKDPQNFYNEVGCSMRPSDLIDETCQFVEEHEIGAASSSATDDAALELMLQVEPGFMMEFLTTSFENHHGVALLPMDLGGSDNDDMFNSEVVGPDSRENPQCCFDGVEEAAATNSSSMILQIPEAPQSCNNTMRSSDIEVVPITRIDDFVYTSEPEPGSSSVPIILIDDFVSTSEPSTCGNGMDGEGSPKEDLMDQANDSPQTIPQSCNTMSSDSQEEAFSVVPIILIDDDFVYTSEPEPEPCSSSSTCGNGMDGEGGPKEDQMVMDQTNDSPLKLLVPMNNNAFGPLPIPSDRQEEEEKGDPGTTLCSPFFSCDLIQSDMQQQEYSPLGIRQMMMWSSMKCLLSPSMSPDAAAVLKSAAKMFTCSTPSTPTILKKRHHRDMLSPLSEKRSQKKFKRHEFSGLSKNLSRLVDAC